MKKNKLFSDVDNIRIISLALILWQTLGLRIFQGLGTVLLIIVLILNFQYLLKASKNDIFKISVLIFGSFIVGYLKEENLLTLLVRAITFFSVFAVCMSYKFKSNSFCIDLYKLFTIIYYYTFLSLIVAILFKSKLSLFAFSGSYYYLTFLNIFYYGSIFGPLGIPRLCGIAWEPGCMQMILNIYFFLSVIHNDSIKKLFIISLLILFTFSTSGYVILVVNFIFFLIYKKKLRYLPLSFFALLLILPLVKDNLENKFTGDDSSSGIIRMRDLNIGFSVMMNYPILGLSESELENNTLVKNVEDKVWENANVLNWTQGENGYLAGGYTSGLLHVFILWGIPIGLWLYYLFYKSPFWRNKLQTIIFLAVCLLSFISEPITNTSFFYFICFSTLFCLKPKNPIVNKYYDNYNNSNI